VKGGEGLGNEESSSEETREESRGEEEEVIPAMDYTPGVRPLTPGVSVPCQNRKKIASEVCPVIIRAIRHAGIELGLSLCFLRNERIDERSMMA